MSDKPVVGFIGVGLMGHGMAKNILSSGYDLTIMGHKNRKPVKGFTPEAMSRLVRHSWPGNVRELRSVVELAAVLASGEEIHAEDLDLTRNDAMAEVLTEDLTMREYQRRIIKLYMQRCGDDTAEVARRLGIGQTTVYRMLKEDRQTDT